MSLRPVHPVLEEAHTLEASWYTDPVQYQRERESLFFKTWQPVGRAEQVSQPGDFFTAELLGEPLVILRDTSGTLRAFYNLCRHRAGAVATGCGRRKTLQCHYHGWTYGLDGSLLKAPEFEGVRQFCPSEYGLRPVRVEALGPFVFVNLDDQAAPLSSVVDDIPQRLAPYQPERKRFAARRDYVIRCNWKVYIDNYLEGYHVPVAHPSLYRELDYANYTVTTSRYFSEQRAPVRPRDGQAAGRMYDAGQEALYFWIFPNWVLNVYPDNLSINIVLPLGLDQTLTIFEWYVDDPSSPTTQEALARTMAFSDEIQQEDIALCEAVQARLGSRAFRPGRYSAARENGLHHFHRLLSSF